MTVCVTAMMYTMQAQLLSNHATLSLNAEDWRMCSYTNLGKAENPYSMKTISRMLLAIGLLGNVRKLFSLTLQTDSCRL